MDYLSPNSSGTSMSSDSECENIWKGGVPGCARCGNIIYDKTILCILDKVWHPSCLQCSVCNKQLSNTCYSNGNNLLCYEDYIRTNSIKCACCKKVLSDNEYVRKVHGNVYHQTCFRCASCERPLQTGEKFYLRDDDRLVCADDYNVLKANDSNLNDSDSECSTGSGKRQRTSITPQQLQCLMKVFDNNPKPSRETRRQLSRDLRLDYRVIQVWFQNKRAKSKKSLNFQHQYQENSSDTLADDGSHRVDNEQRGRFVVPFHETLYRTPTRRINSNEWLTTVLAHDSVPPNVDLSPVHIINGEINQTALHRHIEQSESETERHVSTPRNNCIWQ